MINKIIGNNFKRYRKLMRLKQSEIAERLNVSTDTISRLEQGKSIPGIETLIEISKILDIPIDYLVSENSRKNLIFSSIVFVERLKELSDNDLKDVTEVLKSAFEYINIRNDNQNNTDSENE